MKCSKCSANWPDSVEFCWKCGARLIKLAGGNSASENAETKQLRTLLPMVGLKAKPPGSGPATSDAIKVSSVAEEYVYLKRLRCVCGGSYHCDAQALLEVEDRSYDQLDVSCSQCGAAKVLLFDINSFLGKR